MAEALRKHVAKIPGKYAIVLGDRREMCERALELVYDGYKLAHVAGGETRHDDPQIAHPDHRTRNAVSMLSDIHFVCNDFAKANLKRIGITRNVYVAGLPSLDELVHISRMPAPLRDGFALVLIHPHPSDRERSASWVNAAADAIDASDCDSVVLVEPNADDGGWILDNLRNLGAQKECMLRRLSLDDFIEHLRRCSVFITNSSAGRIEAPIFETKVIEIGDRQAGRAPMGTPWHHPEGRACKTIAAILREAVK